MNTSTLVLRAAAVRAYESAKTLLAMLGLAALAGALFLPLQRDSLVKPLPSLDGDAMKSARIAAGPIQAAAETPREREQLRRFGDTEAALQMYAGAYDEPTSQYAGKVFAERARLEVFRQKAKKQSV